MQFLCKLLPNCVFCTPEQVSTPDRISQRSPAQNSKCGCSGEAEEQPVVKARDMINLTKSSPHCHTNWSPQCASANYNIAPGGEHWHAVMKGHPRDKARLKQCISQTSFRKKEHFRDASPMEANILPQCMLACWILSNSTENCCTVSIH